MKNTFGVTMALLLVLTIGGSYLGYKKAVTSHHTTAEHKDDGHGAKKSHDTDSDHKEKDTDQAEDQTKTEESKAEAETSEQAKKDQSTEPADQADEVAKTTDKDQAKTEESKAEAETSEQAKKDQSTEPADQTDEVAKTTDKDQAKTEESKAEAETSEQATKEKEPAEQTKVVAKGDKKAGQEKYVASCGGCHGANAEGGLGPALADSGQWTIEEFTVALREGRTPTKTLAPTMPRYKAMEGAAGATDEDLTNVHAYLATLK